jgi:hypothetical protein
MISSKNPLSAGLVAMVVGRHRRVFLLKKMDKNINQYLPDTGS